MNSYKTSQNKITLSAEQLQDIYTLHKTQHREHGLPTHDIQAATAKAWNKPSLDIIDLLDYFHWPDYALTKEIHESLEGSPEAKKRAETSAQKMWEDYKPLP